MNCEIRKWKMTDAGELAKVLNNKNIHDNLRDGLPYPYTQQDAKEYIKSMLDSDRNMVFAFAITIEDMVIGSICVYRKDNIHFKTAEIGYYIAQPYWGRGIGTKAVKKICNYIFQNTNIIRIYAEPFAINIASCRILEKAGFHYEGTLRKNAVKNDIVLDMKMYSILKESLFI